MQEFFIGKEKMFSREQKEWLCATPSIEITYPFRIVIVNE